MNQLQLKPTISFWVDDDMPSIITDRTYYVAQSGNDTNNGLSSGSPFGTIQKAMQVIGGNFVPSNVTVTVQLLDGTIEIGETVVPPVIDGSLVIQGNAATPSNVIVSLDGTALGFWGTKNARFTLKDFSLSSAAAGAQAILADEQAIVHFGNLIFGSNFTVNMVVVRNQGMVIVDSAFTIAASSPRFLSLVGQGQFNCVGVVVTITGTPAFSAQFCLVTGGYARFDGCTFSGSATGQRYAVNNNGVVFTNAGGANFLPGNSAGAAAAGGQYQ